MGLKDEVREHLVAMKAERPGANEAFLHWVRQSVEHLRTFFLVYLELDDPRERPIPQRRLH